MSTLTFPHEQLRELLKSAEARWPKGQRRLRHQDAPKPGFWLVCDYGVYLMHNANLDEDEKPAVVHALECNPSTMPFDLWLDEKASYGCMDEVEFIAAEVICNAVATGRPLIIDFDPERYFDQILVRSV
ncbi:DUF3085 domain-containing protein [Sinorhizobium meliloti]|uniref:DUF3085 domain-containing protein n=1 Tax=Rhizobium meliloti TaxID=382 RepID=UPI000FDBC9CD|nr:DUF3085 domain-containing protein [Sinorhizobium meliloti]RVH83414.1 DUF3085 domain-containing protein [Sinorhizobium meliloti]RVM31625.1 DUF3085 domain-containing protein [Sinorhizobium meliloti]RVO04420.1 DUF3085 domain-containing protein [Sinorhizobium meliloti]